jgi:hypothetical protein
MQISGWKELTLGQGKHPSSLQIAVFCMTVGLLLAGVHYPISAGFYPAVPLTYSSQQDQGYWRFVEVWTAKGPDAVPPDKSVSSMSDGSLSGSYTIAPSNGNPANTYGFSCTWFWQTQSGLDQLIPGEQISGSMTVTDTSSGKIGNAIGSIAFDQPYLPVGVVGSSGIKLLEVKAGSLGSATQNGYLVIPQGPGKPDWYMNGSRPVRLG